MPQAFKVVKAFQSTNRETGEPDVVKTQGGEMHKFMVQVENQPVQGWLQILKKPGNEVKPGDELYGDIVENNWGKPQFNRAQKPFDGNAQGQAPAQTASQPSGDLEDKVDYLISLVENFLDSQGVQRPAATNESAPSDDDGPADLSKLGY